VRFISSAMLFISPLLFRRDSSAADKFNRACRFSIQVIGAIFKDPTAASSAGALETCYASGQPLTGMRNMMENLLQSHWQGRGCPWVKSLPRG